MSTNARKTTKETSNKKKERTSLPSSEPRQAPRTGAYSSSKPEANSVDRHLTRRLTRGEKILHNTKLELMAHQDDRTRIRIQQLHDEYRNKDKYGQSGEEYAELKLEGERHEVYDNAPSFAVPSTAMRQNITQRRSQGRAKDRESIGSTSVPIQALLARRSLPRAKDA